MSDYVPSTLLTVFYYIMDFIAVLIVYNLVVDSLTARDQQAAINNLQELQKSMNEVASSSSNFMVNDIQYFIDSGHILVGFSKDDNFVMDACGYDAAIQLGFEEVQKPKRPECSKTSCLCLYQETYDDYDFEEDNYPVSCLSVKADKIFTLDYLYQSYLPSGIKYSEEEKVWKNVGGSQVTLPSDLYPADAGNFNYASLFIYGQCEDHLSDVNFGIQKLFIEKTVQNGKTYLFVAPSKTTNIVERQRVIFKSKESNINPEA